MRRLALLLALAAPVFGQTAATGTISGKILKPATGEYVRGAEIRIEGINRSVESENSGEYIFGDVPAGEASLVVSFTGYRPASAVVRVEPGKVTVYNFNLYGLLESPARTEVDKEQPITLAPFLVTSSVEGQAKSIQEQKRHLQISDHVSSDAFGDVPEGNVGEFLKNIPGVELETVQFDARGPRLRGMDPQYVGVTIDGVKVASADAFNATIGTDNAGTDGSRAFGFESVNLSSVDSVEVFKSLSANMDADAPAGSINLRSKRAFDRQGRMLGYRVGLNANTEAFTLGRSYGPGDHPSRKTRGNFGVNYSDVFLNQRLGILFDFSQSSLYNTWKSFQMTTVNRSATSADPRPAVPAVLSFNDGPKITDRSTATFTLDYRFSPKLAAGVTTTYGRYHANWDNRSYRFQPAANTTAANGRTSVLGADPMLAFETGAAGDSRVSVAGDAPHKFTNTIAVTPRFEYKPTANLRVDGILSWSDSKNNYKGGAEGSVRHAGMDPLTGVKFIARRSSYDSADWVVTQTSGPDWGNLSNYNRATVTDEGRSDRNQLYTGALDFRYTRNWSKLPTIFSFGLKSREDYRDFQDFRNWNQYEYIGPGGVTPSTTPGIAGTGGSWAGFASANRFDVSSLDIFLNSLSGLPPVNASRTAVGELFQEHPAYFSRNAYQTANNYYTAFIANDRNIRERVDAGYLMATMKLRKTQWHAGLRIEETSTILKQYFQRPSDEVKAAGYTTDASGRATTIEGLQYQFMEEGKQKRRSDYSNHFASTGLRHTLTNNLVAQLGYNEAISRPSLTKIAGLTTVNEQRLTIDAKNPGLLPESSRNYSAKLAYYLPFSGSISVGVFQNDIRNFLKTTTYLPGTWEHVFTDIDSDEYAGYSVNSTSNDSDSSRRFRGLEVEYREMLAFLPPNWKRSHVYVNYTRNYASIRRGGLVPHQINTGGALVYKNLSLGTGLVWRDETPWSNNLTYRYRAAHTKVDVNASYRFKKYLTLSVSGRDVGNVGQTLIEKHGEAHYLYQQEIYGTMWTFTLAGTF